MDSKPANRSFPTVRSGQVSGMATEATMFDGHSTGERLHIHSPNKCSLTRFGFASAFSGKVNLPSVFAWRTPTYAIREASLAFKPHYHFNFRLS